MADLSISEAELLGTSRDVGDEGAELSGARFASCSEAEALAIPGGNETDLEAVTIELERFIRTLAERSEEASDACHRAATDFADADIDYAEIFNTIRTGQP